MLRSLLPASAARRAFQPMSLAGQHAFFPSMASSYYCALRLQATKTAVSASYHGEEKRNARKRRKSPAAVPFIEQTVQGSNTLQTNSNRLQFDSSKAGMQNVNKAHVQNVIRDLSKGSQFFNHEQQRSAQRVIQNKAIVIRAQEYLKHAMPEVKEENAMKAALYGAELEKSRDLSRVWCHIDMDSFYASVEVRRDPSLKDIPFAVGNQRMLSTSNYVARQYGVRSGMPGFIAKKLCPQLKFVPNDFPAYEAAAAEVRAIARRFDPNFVTLGLDDLTLELTPFLASHPGLTAAQVCRQFRAEVEAETKLTCSGGLAPTPAFAKMASNRNKPNGQFEIRLHTRAQVLNYVKDIPVRQFHGIGAAQESLLNALGIFTCGDVLLNREILVYLFPEKTAKKYLAMGLGTTRTHVERVLAQDVAEQEPQRLPTATGGKAAGKAKRATAKSAKTATADAALTSMSAIRATGEKLRLRKSISKCATLFKRLHKPEHLHEKQQELFMKAHAVLLSEGLAAQTVFLQYTLNSFDSHTLQRTLSGPGTADATRLKRVLNDLATTTDAFKDPASIRCLGVGFTKLARSSASPSAAPTPSVASKKKSYKVAQVR